MTVRSEGIFERSTPAKDALPAGPTNTAAAPTAFSSRSISRGGLEGLTGTATHPAPSTARYAETKYQLVPARMPTPPGN